MCEQGDTQRIQVLNKDGGWEYADVDRCIAPIVAGLNDCDIRTVASCCGHGKVRGNIALADGRMLDIFPDYESWEKAKRCLLD